MKYWQKEGWQKATKQNIPNLYLYTWIRVSAWFAFSLNSFLMVFISENNSVLDNMIEVENIFFVMMIILGFLEMATVFDMRKVKRTLGNVIFDCAIILLFSIFYLCGTLKILLLYLIELIVIIYFAIKIHKDNGIIDNSKFVRWRKQKQHEKYDVLVKEMKEKNERERKARPAKEKNLDKMSKKERKQYKEKIEKVKQKQA